jgi:predicted ester cyclase
MTTQSKAAVLTDIIDSFCAKDLDRLRTLVDDQIVYQETGTGRRVEGADAYVAMCQGWLAAFPDIAGKVTSGLEAGDQAAIEVAWIGTNNGPIAMPDGEVPPTGKGIDLRSSIWATFNGDKPVEVRHHLDVLGMLQQLGLAG